jgi:hypothetical protein
MTTALFIIGALTSLGCGWNVLVTGRSTWGHELAWVLGGTVGAAMMVAAIWLGQQP